jgi:hypothetical protein
MLAAAELNAEGSALLRIVAVSRGSLVALSVMRDPSASKGCFSTSSIMSASCLLPV